MSSSAAGGSGPASVSVVIPNRDGAHWLDGCLEGLSTQTFGDFEVVVVDNGSTDGSEEVVRRGWPAATFVALPGNMGFAAAANAGIAVARGRYVALLNNDTVPRPAWLAALVRTLDASAQDVGAVASKMLRMDDPQLVDDAGDSLSWTGAARKLGHGEPAGLFAHPTEVLSVCAGAALYRRSFLEALGGFDERFFAYLEDVDLGIRGRLAGYRYLFVPDAEVLHEGQGSELPRADYVRLVTRNRAMLFAKSFPLSLLLKHLPRLIYGQIYFLLAYRHPGQSLRGYIDLLKVLPHIVSRRRAVSRRISVNALDAMLTTGIDGPPMRALVRRALGRLGL